MANCDEEEVEKRIETEIEASDSVQTELNTIINRMEDALKQLSPLPLTQQQIQNEGQNVYTRAPSSTQSPPKTTAKLPKLEVKKFNGRLQEWQEFWNSFESAIENNKGLTTVDMFAYLHSLVLEPARSTILEFSLTSKNNKAPVEALKKQYGKEMAIKRVYVNDLLNLP